MERLPRGANFLRAKALWELGLNVAGNPATPYGGNRDVCITIGNGSGEEFRPHLRMATGSPILAHGVARGSIEMAFVNPSALLTQAYRGVGLFSAPLPLRVVGVWPTWDWFVFAVAKRLGFASLADIKKARYPLQVSVKEDPTHSTRVLTDQVLGLYGFSLADIESWGGKLHMSGSPGDVRRMEPLHAGTLDAIFDEALVIWFDEALAYDMVPLVLEPEIFAKVEALGWRRTVAPKSRFPRLAADHPCIDYSGWPLYANASLPEQTVYDVCASFAARADEIPWEKESFTDVGQVWRDTPATPIDVPLHPGAERWLKEHKGSLR
ncbi:MAG TPA: TAXI family TRAP transporter solute-binding subunit [Stellaceae bacterium]|nr:TAXI family TRAP transporter solute-binding subunit [Stellaceae bacterium]